MAEGKQNGEFENSLYLTKYAFIMSGIGFFVSKKIDEYLLYYYYFNMLWLFTDVFGELFWLVEGIRMNKSLDELSMVAPCCTTCLLSTFKISPIFINRATLKSAVETLKKLHPENKDENSFDRKLVKESIKLLKSVSLFVALCSSIVIVIFSSMSLMLMAIEYHQTGKTDLKLPFLVKFFFDTQAHKLVWAFMYVHQVWSTIVVCLNIFAVDSLFYAFCTYLCMHFRILGHNYENVICDTNEETREKIRHCVRRHQELIALVDQMEVLYSTSNLFNMMSSSLLICLSGFNITVIDNASATLAFSPFLVMSLTQIFLMSYFGDMLMTSSTRISDSIYKCKWYNASSDVKRSVMLILFRARKPCKVTAANFAVLNLSAFTTILSRSWSYFALLKTMYD